MRLVSFENEREDILIIYLTKIILVKENSIVQRLPRQCHKL